MNKDIKKSIEAACKEPLKMVLKITETKDSNINKLVAIQLYCKKTLEIIDKTIKENL